jgi:ubiquinone/menaquinone biosynthesis C-methylase UbiE
MQARNALISTLTVVVIAACCLTPAPPAAWAQAETGPGLDELEAQYEEAYKAGDYAKALETAEKMSEITWPRHVDTLYKIAAMHAKLGDRDQAYKWLKETLDAGYWKYAQLLKDPDFDLIRNDPEFKKMVRGAWAEGYIEMLERPEREEFQKRDQVMETLALKEGEKVADVGAGSGYFTVPLAKAVGPDGIVWACDIRQEMLDYLKGKLDKEGLDNVRLMLVEPDDPMLPDGRVDTILMVDTLHYITERTAYAGKLKEALAPGGRIVIIDYRPKSWEERPWGPSPEQQFSKETIDEEFAKAGLKVLRAHEFLPEQYFVEYGVAGE